MQGETVMDLLIVKPESVFVLLMPQQSALGASYLLLYRTENLLYIVIVILIHRPV